MQASVLAHVNKECGATFTKKKRRLEEQQFNLASPIGYRAVEYDTRQRVHVISQISCHSWV